MTMGTRHGLGRAVGAVLRRLRRHRKLLLRTLSERTGLSVGYISQVELGRNSASVETLTKLAEGLETQLGAVITEAENYVPPTAHDVRIAFLNKTGIDGMCLTCSCGWECPLGFNASPDAAFANAQRHRQEQTGRQP